jgi:hypothetical protein
MKQETLSFHLVLSRHALLSLTALLIVIPVSFAQTINRKGVTWVAPTTETLSLNTYKVKEETDAGGIKREYISRSEGRGWIPFYTNERSVLVTLGHRRRLVLVNDCPASKSCKVVVVDLASRKHRQIDRAATRAYLRHASPDRRLVIIPQAYAFSPDDSKVLIHMELIYVSAPSEQRQLVNRLDRSYRDWWYVVDSVSGRVLHEYHNPRLFRSWWRT